MKIGRPANQSHEKCQKEGCNERAAPKQMYCSRAHAPLGYYGVKDRDQYSRHKSQVREIPSEIEIIEIPFLLIK